MKRQRVPCNINAGEFCKEPFCKFVYFSKLSKEAFDEWMRKCRQELDGYGREQQERNILKKLVKEQ